MKKKNRTAKKERPLQSEQNFRSEERLGSRRAQKKQKPIRNKQCSSETSLLLFNQLNRVSDVLKCEYTFAEGPTIKGESEKKFDQKPLKQIIKMEEHHEEEEVLEDNMEHEGSPAPLDVPPPTPGEEEEEEGEEFKVPKVPAPEPKPDPKPDPKQDPKQDPKPDPKQDPKPDPKPDPKQDPKPDPKPQEPKTEEPKPPEPKPEPPKPTGDGKGKGGSDFPLFDSAVIDELKHAEAESIKTAKAIEALREEVAEYSKKENLTEDEIKTMLKKQEQLMEKLGEFEAMTKKVGDLVGLAQVASSQLGAPEKPMVTMVDGVRGGESSRHVHPEDILPKVIVCGTGEIDQVPRIIVCEPTKAKDGKHPLYPQIHGERNPSRTTFQNMQPSPGPYAPGCLPPPGIGMPGYPPGVGFPGSGGAFMPGGFPARPSGYPSGPPFQMMQGMGSLPPGMMGPPQGMMGPPQGMMPPGMAPQPGMMQQQSVMPPCLPIPLCPPASPRRHKKSKKDKKTEADGDGKKDRLAEPKDYETLLQEMDCLKGELKNVTDENECLKKKVAESDKSQGDGGGKQHDQPAGGLCRADLQRGMPMCKAEAYKAMGLPIPGIGTKQTCPGAKFAASMGWNENQGCRGELKKSTECPNMAGQEQRQHATGDSPVFTPCGCKMLQQSNAECKKGDMETVVQTMEQEVKSLQKELELVQAERRGLALQKKLLQCMADSGPSTGGGPSPMMAASRDLGCKDVETNQMSIPLQQMYQKPSENLSAVEMQLNSLREQYRKLQEDYNAKVEEVSMVRVEHESAKRDSLQLLEKCREAEARVDDLLERLRAIEMEKSKMAGSKDQMTELEQQLTLAKQRYREGQEELDEVRTTMQDQMIQLEEYRNKYLTAQQTVEEQRRQIDIMELENNRIGEQVNLEIQRVKTQFQEKLQELTPLPDMLKATQLKLQECDQLRQLAERNVEQLLNQSDELKEQNKTLEKELEDLKKSSDSQTAERSNLKYSLTSGEKKIEEIKSENLKLRATVARLEELALSNDRRLDEKMHEVLQLQTQLETLREESARQVSRTKDRCESVRRTLQGQISQLEFQLAQSRAAARTAQKDRDEIRQRMQAQITSLNENFEQAQLRIRSLQSHVNYLKSSYTNIFAPEIAPPVGPKPIDGLTT